MERACPRARLQQRDTLSKMRRNQVQEIWCSQSWSWHHLWIFLFSLFFWFYGQMSVQLQPHPFISFESIWVDFCPLNGKSPVPYQLRCFWLQVKEPLTKNGLSSHWTGSSVIGSYQLMKRKRGWESGLPVCRPGRPRWSGVRRWSSVRLRAAEDARWLPGLRGPRPHAAVPKRGGITLSARGEEFSQTHPWAAFPWAHCHVGISHCFAASAPLRQRRMQLLWWWRPTLTWRQDTWSKWAFYFQGRRERKNGLWAPVPAPVVPDLQLPRHSRDSEEPDIPNPIVRTNHHLSFHAHNTSVRTNYVYYSSETVETDCKTVNSLEWLFKGFTDCPGITGISCYFQHAQRRERNAHEWPARPQSFRAIC